MPRRSAAVAAMPSRQFLGRKNATTFLPILTILTYGRPKEILTKSEN